MSGVRPMSSEEFRLIRGLINRHCGLHFADARAEVLEGKLCRLAERSGCADFSEYYRVLRYEGDAELADVVDALTNNETYFFREIEQLNVLVELIASAVAPFRVLSAGCSTGEEPYTLAMLLSEAGILPLAEIVACDVSAAALARAARGSYAANSFRGPGAEYLGRYFVKDEAGLKVVDCVRDAVSFFPANLLARSGLAALGRFDAVLCRNVMIHFDVDSRAVAVANLYDALADDGLLLLGHSESLHDVLGGFEMVRRGSIIAYRRPAPKGPDAT
jgi:chemotaxis protein methyltransferase CheR